MYALANWSKAVKGGASLGLVASAIFLALLSARDRAQGQDGAVNTSGVLCPWAQAVENPTLRVRSEASWSCRHGVRELVANGIPDHPIGQFPNAHNPSELSEQVVRFAASLRPAEAGVTPIAHVVGFALNGVKFDPSTAGTCSASGDCTPLGDLGPWTLEALGGAFDFGVDANHGHVQPDGSYHYHGMPEGLLTKGRSMTLVGWAIDGFPIYARYGHSDALDPSSPVTVMRSSYRLKTKAEEGRPPTSTLPMGTFTQDYEFVAGSGDLDECNGRFGVTPEFPSGIYHYYVTDTWPFAQRCVKGRPMIPEPRARDRDLSGQIERGLPNDGPT